MNNIQIGQSLWTTSPSYYNAVYQRSLNNNGEGTWDSYWDPRVDGLLYIIDDALWFFGPKVPNGAMPTQPYFGPGITTFPTEY